MSSRSSSRVCARGIAFPKPSLTSSRAVLDTFKNLRDGVNDGRTAAFMWEWFTTKPYLSEVRFIGSVPTPWHSWALVAPPSTTAPSSPLLPVLSSFLTNLTASIHAFDAPAAREGDSKAFVQKHFGYPEDDVQAWLDQVNYPKGDVVEIDRAMVEKTLQYVLGPARASFLTSRSPPTLTLVWYNECRTLEKAGVLECPAEGWDLERFVETSVAKLQ